jgi:colicin import membrane protein
VTSAALDDTRYSLVGLSLSLIGHGLMLLFLTSRLAWLGRDVHAPQIYSVTLEGGKTLGGVSQVPEKSDKSPPAPLKKVSAPEEKKEEPDEKAEVSLKEHPTPVPPKKEEKKKVEPKKVPEKKPTPKPKEPSPKEVQRQYEQAMQRYLGESSEAGGKGFGAGALGGRGMGGGLQRPPEFFRYRDMIRTMIKKGWRWYDTNAELVTTGVFEISPRVEVSNVEVEKSSGNREYDDSVLRAVYKANPLPPPPETVYRDFAKVRMNFDPRE